MNNQMFEEYLKAKFADYAEPVDAGGWEALSSDLNRRAKRRTLYRSFYYGIAVAAAVVLLILVITPPDPQQHHIRQPLNIAVVSPQINAPLQSAHHIQPIRQRSHRPSVVVTPVTAQENNNIEVEVPKEQIDTIQTVSNNPPETPASQTPSNQSMYHWADVGHESRPLKPKRLNSAEGWSVALVSSSANAAGQSPFTPVVQRQPTSVRDMFFVRSNSEVATKYTAESSVQFSPPVSVGVNFQKDLLPWMSIGLGLNYTLLQSKTSSPYLNRTYIIRQYLHYVGLPASVVFSFVHQPALRVYSSAGGSVEKAVSAYYTSSFGKDERVQVSGLQWSVGAGLGVEYSLSKIFGIYVEPGAAYYFDCDQPRSIRTVQPLQFKVEIGLRARI